MNVVMNISVGCS